MFRSFTPGTWKRISIADAAIRASTVGMLFAAAPAPAQDYHLRHYTIDDGLPSSQVHDIDQDGLGRLWLATQSGVAAFDGRRWRTYNLADGLAWADQYALAWDADDGLWSVGSRAPYRVFHLPAGEERWNERPQPPVTSDVAAITSFAVRGGAGGHLAIGTEGDGLFILGGLVELEAGWRHVRPEDGLPDGRVWAVEARDQGWLVATAGGLVEVDLTGEPRPVDLDLPGELTGLAAEPAGGWWLVGDRWLGFWNDTPRDAFELFAEGLEPGYGGRRSAVADRRGGLYFGDPEGLYHFAPGAGVERLGRLNGLASDGVGALFLDREGYLWIGGNRGLNKLIGRHFANYDRRHGLHDDEVISVLERHDGSLILGHRMALSAFGDGRALATLELGRAPGSAVPRRPEPIRDLAEDATGNIWAAAETAGLARIRHDGSVLWFGRDEGLRGAVTSVELDTSGLLWAGTSEGLFAFDGTRFSAVAGSRPLHVRRLFQDPDGGLLLAAGGGLHRHEAGRWHSWRCAEAECSTFAVSRRRAGGWWVGTSAGLRRTADGALALPADGEPRVDRPIYFLVHDETHRLWMGSDDGVLRWDGEALRHFTVRDGLGGRETNRAAGLVDRQGRVWIGTESGATAYRPRYDTGPEPSPPMLTWVGLEAGGQRWPLDRPVNLPSGVNDITFNFRAVSFLDEDRVAIKSWLEGHDEGWQPVASADLGVVRYPRLPAGSYRLHLAAANAAGTWSEPLISAQVTVALPVYRRPLFFLLVALASGALLVAASRHRAQRNYARNLEAEVALRLEELRASETRYRHIFDRSEAAKLILDASDLRILDANSAASRFYGYSLDELRDRSLDDLRDHGRLDERDASSEPVDTASQIDEKYGTDRHRIASGEIRDVETYFSAAEIKDRPALYAIVHDITERRKAEERIAAETERLDVTLRNIDDGVVTTDGEHRIVLFNQAAERLTGWPAALAIGRPLAEVVDLQESAVEGEADSEGGPLVLRCEREEPQSALLVRRDGSRRAVELVCSPIRRGFTGCVLAMRDVTERQQIAGELAKAERLEALGLLAGGIAHDFNNLLTVLLGNLALIGDERQEATRQQSLADAEAALLRARDLASQLLTFSRGGAPVREAASIAEVVAESASFMLSGSNVRAVIDLPDDLWVVEIDAGQISQLINNLFLNAVQAMPRGGRIALRGGNTERPPASLKPGRYVEITISDEGDGIPEELLARVFDPYFSTRGRGRGLGLASSYSIARRHDGLLTVSSPPGAGATFALYLPASDAPIAASAAMPERDHAGLAGGRVLVVDDEEPVRAVLRRIVEQLGYRVEEAADGEEAIACFAAAAERGERFDLVLIDLTIPGGMGGREAIRHLHDLDPDVLAIVISGYSNDPVLADHRRYGFVGRLSKPFRPAELARVLRQAERARDDASGRTAEEADIIPTTPESRSP